MPDVRFEGVAEKLYAALDGAGLAVPWRMTGTFTGEMAFWGKRYGSEPPTWAPTGRSVDIQGVDLYEFRDGLLCSWTIAYDLYGLSQQLGLLPSPRPADTPGRHVAPSGSSRPACAGAAGAERCAGGQLRSARR